MDSKIRINYKYIFAFIIGLLIMLVPQKTYAAEFGDLGDVATEISNAADVEKVNLTFREVTVSENLESYFSLVSTDGDGNKLFKGKENSNLPPRYIMPGDYYVIGKNALTINGKVLDLKISFSFDRDNPSMEKKVLFESSIGEDGQTRLELSSYNMDVRIKYEILDSNGNYVNADFCYGIEDPDGADYYYNEVMQSDIFYIPAERRMGAFDFPDAFYVNERGINIKANDLEFANGKFFIANNTGKSNFEFTWSTSRDYTFNDWLIVPELYIKPASVDLMINMNGGKLAENHNPRITEDGKLVLAEGNPIVQSIYYNCQPLPGGLVNYNDPSWINIEKTGYIAQQGREYYIDKGGTKKYYNQDATYTSTDFTSSFTKETYMLNVNWRPITYDISYVTNGGTPGTNMPTNAVYDEPITISNPTKTGYVFEGWTIEGSDPKTAKYEDNEYISWSEPTTPIKATRFLNLRSTEGTVRLVAKWKPIEYQIIYQGNGGTWQGQTSWSNTAKYGETYTVENNFYDRQGYTFDGWVTESEYAGWTGWSGTWQYLNGQYGIENNTLILKAKWNPNTYNVIYKANGGTGDDITVPVTYGEPFTVKDHTGPNNETFHRTGYHMVSWNRKADGTGTSWTTSNTTNWIWTIPYDVILYAQWEANEYTVTYKANGGVGNDRVVTATYGQPFTVLDYDTYTRTGYHMTSWNENSNGSGSSWTKVNCTNWIWTYTRNVVLYAIWTQNVSGLTVDANGGTVNVKSPSSAAGVNITDIRTFNQNASTTLTLGTPAIQPLTLNSTIQITYNASGGTADRTNDTATKSDETNYVFTGWAKSPDPLNGNLSGNGKTYTFPTNNNASDLIRASYRTEYSTNTTSVTLPNATRTGYTFKGWYTQASEGERRGGAGNTYKPTANEELYAQWSPISYTISYNLNDSTGKAASHGDYHPTSANYDDTVRISNPIRPGYTFSGWTMTNGNTSTAKYGSNISNIVTAWNPATTRVTSEFFKNLRSTSGTVTLVANWTPQVYTIIYKGNGGIWNNTDTWQNTVSTGSQYTVEPNFYQRTGYTFGGWETESGYTGWTGWSGAWNYADGEYGIDGHTLTLFAKWIPDEYTVTYKANGGTGEDIVDTVRYGEQYSVKDYTIFTKPGHQIISWNEAADGTGTSWTTSNTNNWTWTYTRDVILYAQWEIRSFVIRYESNDGEDNFIEDTVVYGSQYTVRPYNTFSRTGYFMTSWNEEPDGSGTPWTTQNTNNWTWTYERNAIVYAQWADRKATIEVLKNRELWEDTNVNVALYQNNQVKYAYATATKKDGIIYWDEVIAGTYDVYASKNSNSLTTLVDTGIDVQVDPNGEATVDYYTLTLNKGVGISAVSGAGIYLKNQAASIDATVKTGYKWQGWSVVSGDSPN